MTPTITLRDGVEIPQLGFGVYQIDPDETQAAVETALGIGYRHIDTAQMYGNERGVGDAISASGLDRSDVFLTSKLGNGAHAPDQARAAFAATLEALGTDHVDLFLVHWPLPTRYDGDFVSTWRTLLEFRAEGRARSVGVSNFQADHIARLEDETAELPSVNQIEVHPYLANDELRAYGAGKRITTEAWSPIAQGRVLEDPAILAVAEEVGRSAAQVTLRWHLQRGDVVFPKSVNADRMAANFALFDFELTPAQVATITALDRGEDGRTGPHPDEFDYLPD